MECTKGEWKAYQADKRWPWCIRIKGKYGLEPTIADIILVGKLDGECKANAHLIAAAPDMYEALKAVNRGDGGKCMRNSCRFYEGIADSRCFFGGFLPKCSPCLKAQWKAIDKALAKAEGKGGDNSKQERPSQ